MNSVIRKIDARKNARALSETESLHRKWIVSMSSMRVPYIALLCLLLSLCSCNIFGSFETTTRRHENTREDPIAPLWPEHFDISYTASTGNNKTLATWNGRMWYDSDSDQERMDNDAGQLVSWSFWWLIYTFVKNELCATYYNKTSVFCSILLIDNVRYVHMPSRDDCCQCCNASQGCGILYRDWLIGAQFAGYQNWHGDMCEGWFIEG